MRMQIKLSPEEKVGLEVRHQHERDKYMGDRIKSILLRDEGWSVSKIAQALRLSNDTVSRYLIEYLTSKSVDPKYRGSIEKLSGSQSVELIAHLRENLYTKAIDILEHVKNEYGVEYTVAGFTDWLNRHDFSYKLTTGRPAKADRAKQQEFVSTYEALKQETPENEPILFIDAVHPTMATKPARGWIARGVEKIILTSASRTRMNIVGAIELSSMKIIHEEYETVNAASIINLLEKIKLVYVDAPKVHIILDQSGYHRSDELAKYAENHNIELHFLPSYSPNLNPIERLWKVMNERARNNRFFKSAKEFREQIREFFSELPLLAESLRSRINDNFHLVDAAK
jgi:transposase